jgi:hypothetical protein
MTDREHRDTGTSARQEEQQRQAEARPTAAVPQARTSAEAREAAPMAGAPGRGWTTFAGTTLIVLAGFQLIWGLAGLLRTTMFFVPSSGLGITWGYPVWSWLHIGLAALLALTAFAVLGGLGQARFAALGLVVVLAFANFLTLPAQPIWSLVMIAVDLLAIYALAARGDELGGSSRMGRGRARA